MNFRYEWRVLTEEGGLVEPAPVDPYYNRMYFSAYGSEEEAYADWEKIVSVYPFWTENEMVLIKIFSKPKAQ